MNANPCDNLVTFLSGELTGAAAEHFETHLRECGDCRDAVDQQRWIDGLLRSPTRLQIEPVPSTILDSLQTSLATRRRRTTLIACGLATAAMLLIAVSWVVKLNRQAIPIDGPGAAPIAPAPVVERTPVIEQKTTAPPRAVFVSNGDAIAVPLESPDANVTVVQLYPTIETERRWRRELAWQLIGTEPNGG